MKNILLILCVPIFLLLGFCQTRHYTRNLKLPLKQEARKVLESEGVLNADVSLDRLDATIEGLVTEEAQREDIANKVSAIGGLGALRVQDSNNLLKVQSSLEMKQEGNVLYTKGNVEEGSSASNFGKKVVSGNEHLQELHDEVSGTYLYKDPILLTTASFQKWLNGYFSFKGDQGFRLSAKDQTLTLFGSLTKELQDKHLPEVKQLADNYGVKFVSDIKTIPSKAPTLTVERKNGKYKTSGVLSSDYEPKDLTNIPEHTSLKLDPYTRSTEGVDHLVSKKWVPFYFASNGDRRFSVVGDRIKLSGVGTPLLQRQWLDDLKGFKKVDKKGMSLFPSEYHYPSYKVESIKDKGVASKLAKTLALNEIYFDISSSEVKDSELPKIENISKAITTIAPDSLYVIGGHTDSTGNLEMNLKLSQKRAESVIALLAEKGVKKDQFSIVPFGSAKSTQKGSNANDRRVEILIK